MSVPRIICPLALMTGCLSSATEGTPPAAPSREDVTALAKQAEEAALTCDLTRARESYDRASALCTDCSPAERVALERTRVRVALLAGEPPAPTLAAATDTAKQLEARDRLAAARLFAELGRWQSPALLEHAAQNLSQAEPRASAPEVLRVVLGDPGITARTDAARDWSSKYQLAQYHFRADGVPDSVDARYTPGACKDAGSSLGIPGAAQLIHGQRIVYEDCYAKSAGKALPGQRVDGVALMSFAVAPGGQVTRLDVYGAFLPEALVSCIGEVVKAKQFEEAKASGSEDVAFRFQF